MKRTDHTAQKPQSDLKSFWKAHDSRLNTNRPSRKVHLGHNLYRGMPAWFNAFFDHFQRRRIRGWVRDCRIEPGMMALDVGCGTGRWIGLMIQMEQKAVGVDLGYRALHFAREQWSQARFVQGKLPFLCFTEETFDWAVSVTVTQHLPHDDQIKTLLEINRLLKPGGYLMLCESIDLSDRSDHVFPNSPAEWEARFRQAGFEIIDRCGCEFVPFVKGFHWVRDRFLPKSSSSPPWSPEVSSVASLMEDRPGLALLIRAVLWFSYPGEYLAGWFLPNKWARLGCFLLRKA